jgi:hypothetical protein
VKRTRAIHHLTELASRCADLTGPQGAIYHLRVVALWAVGEVLEGPHDLDVITVALAVDLPEVPWLTEPAGAEHWSNATRLSRNPIRPLWRSAHRPVWNHEIHRPALLWDAGTGVAADTFAALAEGRCEPVRLAAPTPAELDRCLAEEVDISLRALRDSTAVYGERRWAPGKLTPLSDALWHASEGYLDLLQARQGN